MSRWHTVQQFNLGLYNIIIASDDRVVNEAEGGAGSGAGGETEDKDKKQAGAGESKRRRDNESGVSRGIDFQHLSNVINFDFPLDSTSYLHRVGRTARGNNQVMMVDDTYIFLS